MHGRKTFPRQSGNLTHSDFVAAAAQALEILREQHGMSAKLATLLGISPGTVAGWKCIPLRHVAAISAFTGMPEDALRPDVYLGADRKGRSAQGRGRR